MLMLQWFVKWVAYGWSVLIKVVIKKKEKDGRERCSFSEFDDSCLEGGEMLLYFGEIVVSSQKSLLQKQGETVSRACPVCGSWQAWGWHCFASFLQQDKALQLLLKKGLCPELFSKLFFLVIVQYFSLGSFLKLLNEIFKCWGFGHII